MDLGECLNWISMERKKVASKQMQAISRSAGFKGVEKMIFRVTVVGCNVDGSSRLLELQMERAELLQHAR